jgi:hypothetical protein
VELGLIEGYYGRPWSWEARRREAAALAQAGYRFFVYAPKADPWLRKRWREPPPAEWTAELTAFAAFCASCGLRFGVGLSPYELYRDFGEREKLDLEQALRRLDRLPVNDLAILFDDMRGDLADLAARQVEIMTFIRERTLAQRVLFCPTYYANDPVLDRVFGQRPQGYLEALGAGLDPSIDVFWTGEEVCSREILPGSVALVRKALRRAPVIWDNYPVNDGPRMSPYLHLRAFTGRPAGLAGEARSHAVNPALQPMLSRIPCLTLAMSYLDGEAYAYGEAGARAARLVLGEALGALVMEDLILLNDTGLEHLSSKARDRLTQRYGLYDHPAAGEIRAWLEGDYRQTWPEL